MLKKICWIVAIVFILVSIAYIVLMVKFNDPISVDLTDVAELSIGNQTLTLPWYMRIGISYDGKLNASDTTGCQYTNFLYTLPEAFESSEMNCIVCWDTGKVIAFIGESRAMNIIDETFPYLKWN